MSHSNALKTCVTAAVSAVAPAGCVPQTTTPGIRTGSAPLLVVLGQKPIKVNGSFAVNPDCSIVGVATVRVVTPPAHGTVEVKEGSDFPSYSPLNARAKCNTQRVKGIQTYYTPEKGYTGPDFFVTETVFPNGVPQIIRYPLDVRS